MKKQSGKLRSVRFLYVGMLLFAAQLACAIMSVDVEIDKTPPPQIFTLTADVAATPTTGVTATAEGQVQPQATKEKADSGGLAGPFACFASKEEGITCLTAEGWKSYKSEDTDLKTDGTKDMTACPDGKIYAVTYNELAVFDGNEWSSLPVAGEEYKGGDFVACGADGAVWVGYYKGVSRYAGGEWESFPSSDYDSGEYSGSINGLAVGPDGKVWVAGSGSIAVYDGTSWKEYKEGDGFDEDINPTGLAVDSQGRVYTMDSSGLYVFDGGEWDFLDLDLWVVNSLSVDPQDRLWVNTSDQGVLIYDGSDWSQLSPAAGTIHSNGVNEAVFDGSDRTWLGMAYGIDVLADGSWTHFRMDNADLVENEIVAAAVVAEGPPLPAFLTKQNGSIKGSVVRGGSPVADAEIELCVERIALFYFGETPCSRQPFARKTTTDAEGKFSIPDLPVGYYVLTLRSGDEWIQLGTLTSSRIPVEEGKETDLGELTIKED